MTESTRDRLLSLYARSAEGELLALLEMSHQFLEQLGVIE